jgi:hypothetical protein
LATATAARKTCTPRMGCKPATIDGRFIVLSTRRECPKRRDQVWRGGPLPRPARDLSVTNLLTFRR